MLEQTVWAEKYRPKKVADVILPASLKEKFQAMVNAGVVTNMTLAGPPGTGKTTIARALLEELQCDYIVINGSMNGNIDTLRTEILSFASSVSLTGTRKYVILDEADGLTAVTQQALRNFIEEFSKNCGFILTCNLKNKIIKALHSRCPIIEFSIPKSDMATLAGQFFKRVIGILKNENIDYDKASVAAIINRFFPDWRRVLTELQHYSATGRIDSGILSTFGEASIREVMEFCSKREFDNIRKWVFDNIEQEQSAIFRAVFDHAHDYVDPKSIPEVIVIIADYSYKAAFIVDPEINVLAFFVEIMMRVDFK